MVQVGSVVHLCAAAALSADLAQARLLTGLVCATLRT
jgi:hypothetical protein